MKIAIIGTGIAGLGAAHALSRLHEVDALRDMQLVLSHSANDSLPEFPSLRPSY